MAMNDHEAFQEFEHTFSLSSIPGFNIYEQVKGGKVP